MFMFLAGQRKEKKMEANNVKAMREALLKAIILLRVCEWPDDAPMQDIAEVIDEIEKASSAPPRNCDVGTAVEQSKRMEIYCKAHGTDESGCYRCESCTFLRTDQCGLAWAQMPYEEGGAE